jgi:pyruvate/2-oxoacid:ferredoxin oxidoreductase alpha subunit
MPTRTQQADLLSCAYASHGDTKHVLLFPEDPHECFDFAAAALDLADRLQTPIFVMTDLDIGMNHRLCEPLQWDDARRYDRGKVMSQRRPGERQRLRPLPGRRRRRHPVPHAARHASETAARTSRAARRAIRMRAIPRPGRTTSTTSSGCCRSSRPPRRWCRSR